jgi:hypothetical protein
MCTNHATTACATPNLGRIAAGLTGLLAVVASTRLTLVHVGQTDITSPLSGALIVFGALTVVCAIVAPQAWRDGRHVVAALMVIAALSGECFGLVASIERLASERAERQSIVAAPNRSRALAVAALSDAKTELADAVRRAADSTKGGCLAACEALRANETTARQRVADREQSLKALGGAKPTTSALAGLTGIDADKLELILSAMFGLSLSLGGATLIAYAANASGRVDPSMIRTPATINVALLADDAKRPNPSADTPDPLPVNGGGGLAPVSPTTRGVLRLIQTSGGTLTGSQRDMANQLGISQPKLNRCLGELKAAGLVSVAADRATGTRLTLMHA